MEIIKGCGLIVSFSDNTQAAYTSEELGYLRPYRIPLPDKESHVDGVAPCCSPLALS